MSYVDEGDIVLPNGNPQETIIGIVLGVNRDETYAVVAWISTDRGAFWCEEALQDIYPVRNCDRDDMSDPEIDHVQLARAIDRIIAATQIAG